MERTRVLIVEDEAILAEGIRSILEENGYRVTGLAATGEEAVGAALETGPGLVLMDIRLEGDMDGVEAARQIRERLDVPVVYLTAYADEETLARAGVTAPFGYVVKPYEDRELLAAVQTALLRHAAEAQVKGALAAVEKANVELDYRKRFLETLFATLPAGVLVVNRSHRVWALNAFLERTFGVARADAVSRSVGEILGAVGAAPDAAGFDLPRCCVHPGIHRAIDDAFEGRPTQRSRIELSPSQWGQHRYAELLVSTAAARFEGEDLCVVILEDVTELGDLRRLVASSRPVGGLVGRHPKMLALFDAIRELAESRVPVLIQGQSGTGKDLVARAIHDQGPFSARSFVAVNCGAIPEGLLESELFGHVQGAFTGAIRDKKGRFELAHGGTLFLDEVGELSPHLQVKLLRVLQDGTFERVGGEETVRVDVRLICATNRDLDQEVAGGRFREDLFYRLAVVPVQVPSLAERSSDIPFLAARLMAELETEEKRPLGELTPEALGLLMDHDWPGNVRELKNVIQYAHIKSRGGPILPEHLPPALRGDSQRGLHGLIWKPRLDEDKVLNALRHCGGNKLKAAKLLGVSRSTLYRFLEERFGEEEPEA